MTKISPEQYDKLLSRLTASRVQHLRGQSHLEAWDIRRHLIRVFGFDGWDLTTKSLDLVREVEHPPAQAGGKSRWTVVYRAEVRLTLKVDGEVVATFDGAAAGDSSNQPSLGDAHDMALKTAESQALKRAAINLGDQFGLSLYNGGRADAVVIGTYVPPAGWSKPGTVADVGADDAPVLPEPVSDEPATAVSAPPATVPTPRPPAAAQPAAPTAPAAGDPLAEPMKPSQRGRMFALFAELGQKDDKEKQVQFINWTIRPDDPITSRGDLTVAQAERVISALVDRKNALARQGVAA